MGRKASPRQGPTEWYPYSSDWRAGIESVTLLMHTPKIREIRSDYSPFVRVECEKVANFKNSLALG